MTTSIPDEPTWRMLLAMMERGAVSRERAQVGVWALEQLRGALGEDWPERWYESNGRLPSVLIGATFHAAEFARLLAFAVRLTLLREKTGLKQVVRQLRRHREPHGLAHGLLQLKVASLLDRVGVPSRFEANRLEVKRPADVLLRPDADEVVVECFGIYLDAAAKADLVYDESFGGRLNEVIFRHGVYVAGEMHNRLPDDAREALLEQIDELAVRLTLLRDGPGPSRLEQSLVWRLAA